MPHLPDALIAATRQLSTDGMLTISRHIAGCPLVRHSDQEARSAATLVAAAIEMVLEDRLPADEFQAFMEELDALAESVPLDAPLDGSGPATGEEAKS